MIFQTAIMPIVHHPFAYRLGPLTFTGFGVAVLLAFVISQYIAQRELARRGHNPDPIGDLIFAAVIGGLLGAKIYYAAVITRSWSDLFSRAGFVFWGGLVGGILAVAATIRWKKLSFTRISDVGGICIAAAYAVGRTGCWAVGDDYGAPWVSRWAVAFPEGAPASTAANMAALFHTPIPAGTSPTTVLSVYPTQLFEVALGFGMFLLLWRMRGHRHAEGWLFGLYCVLAGLERFVIEFFRAKDDRLLGPFTLAQAIAVAFALAGAAWMVARSKVTERAPGIYAVGTARA
jgi:phosphatidylglycerol:prolipoprotein diacylglycerol transferase